MFTDETVGACSHQTQCCKKVGIERADLYILSFHHDDERGVFIATWTSTFIDRHQM